jgi:diadenylate cyclase
MERETKLGDIIDTGTIVNAVPSVPIICNIFFNKAPLHDGAMIVRDGMLYAAGCILPLTKRNNDVAIELGTRHRAAIGMSENSDAVVIVVSEETGQISIALGGTITRNYTRESLQNELNSLLLEPESTRDRGSFFASIRRTKNEK